jgi:hypothetical protein
VNAVLCRGIPIQAQACVRDVTRPEKDLQTPTLKETAEADLSEGEEARDWERLFIGEIKAGRDPRRPRVQRKPGEAVPTNVADFLDAYMERCVKPAVLRSIRSIRSRVVALKEYLGELPLDALEEPDEITRFKTESDYADEVEIATVHRALEALPAAMNWGMAQTPPLFKKSPFYRFGGRMNKKLETARDRRLSRDQEKMLLDAALQKTNTPEHQFVGRLSAAAPPEVDGWYLRDGLHVVHHSHDRMCGRDVENRKLAGRQHPFDFTRLVAPCTRTPGVIDPEEPALHEVLAQPLYFLVRELRRPDIGDNRI